NNVAMTNELAPTVSSIFPSLEADFFIDPASASSFFPGSGIHGYDAFAIRNGNTYAYVSESGANFTPHGAWFHRSIPLSSFMSQGSVNLMRALTFQLTGVGHNLNGHVTFWVDNIVFTAPPPPPSLTWINRFNGATEAQQWV